MASQECFVCGQSVNGDDAFFQHHLNRCLDSQAAAPSPSSAAYNGAAELDLSPFGDSHVASDAALALALSATLDAGAAFELQQSETDQLGRIDPGREGGELTLCPICERSWEEMEIGEGDREGHAEACLSARGEMVGSDEEEEEEQGVEVRGGFGRKKEGKASDEVEGVPDLLPVISRLLVRSHTEGKTRAAYLCNESVEHISQKLRDFGYGCGYRNAQMLFSSLRNMDSYALLKGKGYDLPPIPTIPDFQAIIEAAWKQGYDPPGAAHFRGKLRGSRKWVGTTEIYTAFTRLGIRAKVIDFPKVRGSSEGTHGALVRWITQYFETPLASSSASSSKKRPLEPSSPTNALDILMESKGSPVKETNKQPLYLQHQGHSRTVIGVDVGKGGDWLLLFDPGKRASQAMRAAALATSSSAPNKRVKSASPPEKKDAFWGAAPGFGQIWHGKAGESNGARKGEGGLDLAEYSKHLEVYRVELRSLSRKDEYQVLFVEEGPMLTSAEKKARKVVRSTSITS